MSSSIPTPSLPSESETRSPDCDNWRSTSLAGCYGDESEAIASPSLLSTIDQWRDWLAQDLMRHHLDERSLNAVVNQLITRILWLQLCEEQGVLPRGTVLSHAQYPHIHRSIHAQLNSILCGPDNGHVQSIGVQAVGTRSSLHLSRPVTIVSDAPLETILQQAHTLLSGFPSKNGVTVLGQVYEHCLEEPIVINSITSDRFSQPDDAQPNQPHRSHCGNDASKPLPRKQKSRGIYYTPACVVDCILEQTLERYLANPDLECIAQMTVLDPACGSGAFLIRVYQRLLQWYRHYYIQAVVKGGAFSPILVSCNDSCDCEGQLPHRALERYQGEWRLTVETKQNILHRHIYGVDLDQQAVEITRLSLLSLLMEGCSCEGGASNEALMSTTWGLLCRNIRQGNALIGPDITQDPAFHLSESQLQHIHPFDWEATFSQVFERGGFDIVLGNPPYIDAEWMSRYQPAERHYCATHYAVASGNWDVFCVFCEKALQLCRHRGLSSFIVPNKLGSAEYAHHTRHLLTQDNQLLYLRDYSATSIFSIAVYPLVYTVRKEPPTRDTVQWERVLPRSDTEQPNTEQPHTGPPNLERRELDYQAYFGEPQRPWAIAPTDTLQELMTRVRGRGRPLTDIATVVGAATVAEAYALQPLLGEASELTDTVPLTRTLKLINSGTIDRYTSLWGRKPTRYLKQRYQSPIIPPSQEHHLPERRLRQARHPKIVIAGMTLVLEGLLDATGEFLAGKSTTIILSPLQRLRYLLAILNSRLMSVYYRIEFGGNALSGGYLRIGPPQVKRLPIVLGTDAQQAIIIDLVNHLLSVPCAEDNNDRDERSAIAHQIDQQVYQLYGLSDEDITLVESLKVGRSQ